MSGLVGNRNVISSTGKTKNAPRVQTDEMNGDDDEDDDDDEDGLKEEVTGTEDCLIKKGHSLECKPESVVGTPYDNTISDKDKDSAGKALD